MSVDPFCNDARKILTKKKIFWLPNGVPYIKFGAHYLDCHHGPDRHKAEKVCSWFKLYFIFLPQHQVYEMSFFCHLGKINAIFKANTEVIAIYNRFSIYSRGTAKPNTIIYGYASYYGKNGFQIEDVIETELALIITWPVGALLFIIIAFDV